MAILSKGQTFASADSVTSTKLNNLVDAATFVSGASGTTDDSSLEVNGSGRLQVKDSGISSAKIAASAVTTAKIASATGASDGVTYSKIQHVANMRVLGNTSGSLAAPAEVTILDEDTMSSDSATALATQQSIKAYVDTEVAGVITRGTAVASTSGTSIDFTSIPSSVKRITVLLSGVSTNGTSPLIIRLGDSGGFETSGYTGSTAEIRSTPDIDNASSGILLSPNPAATDTFDGIVTIINITGNTWVSSVVGGNSNTINSYAGGCSKTLTATLDSIRITTSGGANTFDAGTVNIMYE